MSVLTAVLEPETLDKLLKAAALFSSGVICGNAVCVSAVAHPSMLAMPTIESALKSWNRTFERTKNIQIKLSMVHSIGTLGTIALNKYLGTSWRPEWLISWVVLSSMMPYTLMAIHPINKLLCQEEAILKEKDDKWIKEKIDTWGKLHAVKTLFGGVAFGVLCYSVCF